jgi:hypothetical protein
VRWDLVVAGVVFLSVSSTAMAQQATPARPYDGIQAGLDAYRLGEEKRQVGMAQQLYLNDQMRFWNGYPTSTGQTIYYGYLSPAAAAAYGYSTPYYGYGGVGPLMTRANLDYVYAYGGGSQWGGYGQYGYSPLSVFQPWPYVPGDIYGYPAYYPPARQPIGQTQVQTGPNRWESHPVYNPPITNYQAMPPVSSPLLNNTPYATPQEIVTPVETVLPPPPPDTGATVGPTPPGPPASASPAAPSPIVPRRTREY